MALRPVPCSSSALCLSTECRMDVALASAQPGPWAQADMCAGWSGHDLALETPQVMCASAPRPVCMSSRGPTPPSSKPQEDTHLTQNEH